MLEGVGNETWKIVLRNTHARSTVSQKVSSVLAHARLIFIFAIKGQRLESESVRRLC